MRVNVKQVNLNYVLNNLGRQDLYRIILCNDSHAKDGKPHYAARIKAVNSIPVGELTNGESEGVSYVQFELDE